MAAAIRAHIRGSDFCARYGGDEFVAVLSGCDRDAKRSSVRAACRTLSHASSSRPPRGAVSRLGISVGVSVFPDDGDDDRQP